jgi:hypothetical protein
MDSNTGGLPAIPTYDDLIAAYKIRNPGDPQIRGRISSLRQYQKFSGGNGSIGAELDGQFEPKLKKFLDEKGGAKGTLANHKSYLFAWKELLDRLQVQSSEPKFAKLGDALRYYFEVAKAKDPELTPDSLGKRIGQKKISDLYKVAAVYPDKALLLEKAEEALGAPKGVLALFVRTGGAWSKSRIKRNQETLESAKEVAEEKKKTSYRLGEKDVPNIPSVLEDFSGFFRYKIADVPEIKRHKRSAWRLTSIDQAKAPLWALPYVSTAQEYYCATACSYFMDLLTYFGALAQVEPRPGSGSKKYSPNDFRLWWLADYARQLEALEILQRHFGDKYKKEKDFVGKYTLTVKKMLLFGKVLVNPIYGYLTQHPEFRHCLTPPIVEESDWNEWCKQQYDALHNHITTLDAGKKFIQTRPTLKDGGPVWPFLQRQHPLEIMYELEDRIAEHLDRSFFLRTDQKRFYKRTLFFTRMIERQPLRIKMFELMTWDKNDPGPDGRGNLYRRADGTWAIRFPKSVFKNERGSLKRDYDVAFDADFSEVIETYFNEDWLDDGTQRVFATQRSKNPEKRTTKLKKGILRTGTLASAFTRVTGKFLFEGDENKGFGPHAVRHLVATEYIRNHEDGWQTAATVLHDEIMTVKKAYAFVKTDDGYKYYRAYLTEQMKEWKKRKKG